MNQKLLDGLKRLNIELTQRQIEQLEGYGEAVLKFNQVYNLMKADDMDDLVVRHILDSLVAVPHLKEIAARFENPKFGDIGSGGGCPGIPLAIVFDQYDFTLVERMEKRCTFLIQVINSCGIKNAKILCTNADSVPADSFDIEVLRAFHPMDNKIVKMLFSMLKKGGYVAAFKARAEKIAEEMEGVKHLVPDYQKIEMTVPFMEDHERNLVVIKK